VKSKRNFGLFLAHPHPLAASRMFARRTIRRVTQPIRVLATRPVTSPISLDASVSADRGRMVLHGTGRAPGADWLLSRSSSTPDPLGLEAASAEYAAILEAMNAGSERRVVAAPATRRRNKSSKPPSNPPRLACDVLYDSIPAQHREALPLAPSRHAYSISGYLGVSRGLTGRGPVYSALCRLPGCKQRRLGYFRDPRTAALAVALATAQPSLSDAPGLTRQWIERSISGHPPEPVLQNTTASAAHAQQATAAAAAQAVATAAEEGLTLAKSPKAKSGYTGVRRSTVC
jgi:hypothetical protein